MIHAFFRAVGCLQATTPIMPTGKANIQRMPNIPPDILANCLSSQVISAVGGGAVVATLLATRGLASSSQTVASSGYSLPQYLHFFMCDVLVAYLQSMIGGLVPSKILSLIGPAERHFQTPSSLCQKTVEYESTVSGSSVNLQMRIASSTFVEP